MHLGIRYENKGDGFIIDRESSMKNKITSVNLKNHFKCTYKTYLTFKGECGEKNAFKEFFDKKEAEYRHKALDIFSNKNLPINSTQKEIRELNHQEYKFFQQSLLQI